MATIVVIEDEALLAKSVARTLRRQGHAVETAGDGEAALGLWRELQPDLLLLDLRFPGMGGIELLRIVRRSDPDVLAIVMTAYGDVDTAVEAMKLGAQDFLRKPVDLEALKLVVTRTLETARLKQRLSYFQEREAAPAGAVELIGESPAMGRLREMIRRFAAVADVAAGELPAILIQGETGSGKELVARNLHLHSPHADQPFIEINCASLPHTLVEAELFGFERGAFTDAKQTKPGLFELAEAGTLFLDEIGELAPEAQAKLLRVLEHRRVRRLGGVQERPVNCRILAATNRELRAEADAGRFRPDLYYRIAALHLEVPPLRAREGDARLLVEHFLAEFARKYRRPPLRLSPAAGRALEAYPWPGNVRELRHALERAVLLSEGDELRPEALGLELRPVPPAQGESAAAPALPPGMTLEALERAAIRSALDACGGNVSRAARRLGLGREALRYRLRKIGADGGEPA